MPQGIKTTCPYCGVGCGLIIQSGSDGRFHIKGDADHPANYGRLCSKGSALGETLDLEDRLLYPEINGKRSDWDSVLDLIAGHFQTLLSEWGSDSLAFYVSGQILTEDYYVANKLMKGFIGSGNIDTNSRLCMASSVAGHRRAFGTDTVPGCYEDLELADVIVLVGSNLLWCHPVLYQRIVAARTQRPAMKVVLIDPRRTKSADLADLHLALEGDSDGALFCGLLAYLEEKGKTVPEWIARYTTGYSEALREASGWSIGRVAVETGLSPEDILTFYQLWADNERVVTAYSQGVNQSVVGTDKVNAIINCHLATARIGRKGMGPFSLTGQPNAMGGRETGGLANMLAAHMDIDNPEHHACLSRFWQTDSLTRRPGLKAVDMFRAVADGQIKAIWIMATNPVVSMPEANLVREALRRCPFVIVSDLMATNDTMDQAHVRLPSLAWGEKEGTVTNSERRISRQRAFLSPPGEAKADWWQLAEVAKRMGFETAFSWRDQAAIFREYAALTSFENEGRRDLDLGALANLGAEDYSCLPPFQWPQERDFNPCQNTRFFADGGFFTPDKKARFIAIRPPHLTKHDNFFRLNTGRVRDQWHTMTRTGKSARLMAHMAEPYCEIHPDDAEGLGIRDADLVRVRGSGQAIIVRALLSHNQKKGHVFVPMHWNDQWSSAARVDSLIQSITDPFSGQPASKGSFVDVSRAGFGAYGFALCRHKPKVDGLSYWALAKTVGGWRLEFALAEKPEAIEPLVFDVTGGGEQGVGLIDELNGSWRYASFDRQQLRVAFFLSTRGPVEASRSWLASQLSEAVVTPEGRLALLAGFPAANKKDKGAIICSCLSVGVNDIIAAVRGGCHTVEGVSQATQAGTNCGSCKAEVAEIIRAELVPSV